MKRKLLLLLFSIMLLSGAFAKPITGYWDGYIMYLSLHLDPSLVKIQFQVAAFTSGYKARDYFKKFPGRFISAHLQDYSPADHKKKVVMSTGIVAWKDFLDAAKVAGVKYIFVREGV